MKHPAAIALVLWSVLLLGAGLPAFVGRLIAPYELMPWESGADHFFELFERH